MEYVDTGSRESSQALGSWLERVVLEDRSVVAVRWQSGFFTVDAVSYFVDTFSRLQADDSVVRILVGSNHGVTTRADLEALLQIVGSPRENLSIGIVRYAEGFFHPKTVHVARADGSEAAYVGSANLTGSGVSSLHVEAGLTLDTREGDDPNVVSEIATAVDAWFSERRDGLYMVREVSDLADLEDDGVIGAAPTRLPSDRP